MAKPAFGTKARPFACGHWLLCAAAFISVACAAEIKAADDSDVFYGPGAGAFTTSGLYDTAIGYSALYLNTTGSSNMAIGTYSLSSNTTGYYNTASGVSALYSNTTAYNNTASGYAALYSNTANNNTASGWAALYSNTSGANNTAEGMQALYNGTIGSSNIALGYQAGYSLTTGSNNIDIGNPGVAGESGKIRIGTKGAQTATYIAGIRGKTVASATGVAVRIDSTGKLGTVLSSARYKNDIKPMEKASEALLKLEPVTFHYKEELDPDGVRQFGLIAEQVEKIDPDLVVRDEDGKVSTVCYEAVNAMLLNEFLKEHRTVQKQQTKIAELNSAVAKQQTTATQQQKQIEALTAGLQKVSDQVQLTKRAPRVVANDE